MEENLTNQNCIKNDLSNQKPKYKLFLSLSLLIILLIFSIIIILYLNFSKEKATKDNNEINDSRKNSEKNAESYICKEDEDCLSCENNKCIKCKAYFELSNDKCKPSFSFKAIYQNIQNKRINFINKKYKEQIIKLIIDDQNSPITTNYEFNYIGNHTIYMLLNITPLQKLEDMFYGINNLVSINFTNIFDIKNIKS